MIPCRKPKSNGNNNGDKYKWERWREEENREARVFHVVWLCEPTSTKCNQWDTSLLYSLCMICIFWMIKMCCEVSYLYIGLLTQLSYLTYVGFLNSFLIFFHVVSGGEFMVLLVRFVVGCPCDHKTKHQKRVQNLGQILIITQKNRAHENKDSMAKGMWSGIVWILDFYSLQIHLPIIPKEDSFIWATNSARSFSVKSAYLIDWKHQFDFSGPLTSNE